MYSYCLRGGRARRERRRQASRCSNHSFTHAPPPAPRVTRRSKHAKNIVPLPGGGIGALELHGGDDGGDGDAAGGVSASALVTEAERELTSLKASLAGTELVGALAGLCKTLDQAKAVLTFAEAIAEKTLRSTVALTAGRGRGKSAALGLAIAAAIGYGYANVFVTSPNPENLKTLFEFVFKGLESLAYKEHLDYEAVASTNPEFGGAIVRVNLFRGHRQVGGLPASRGQRKPWRPPSAHTRPPTPLGSRLPRRCRPSSTSSRTTATSSRRRSCSSWTRPQPSRFPR